MNSFNTHEETMKTLRKYKACNIDIHCFNQSQHPRVVKESLLPLPRLIGTQKNESNIEWLVIADLKYWPTGSNSDEEVRIRPN